MIIDFGTDWRYPTPESQWRYVQLVWLLWIWRHMP